MYTGYLNRVPKLFQSSAHVDKINLSQDPPKIILKNECGVGGVSSHFREVFPLSKYDICTNLWYIIKKFEN